MQNGPDHLKDYLTKAFSDKLENEGFEEGIYVHLTSGYKGVAADDIKIKIET
jgi:hypothetical protein